MKTWVKIVLFCSLSVIFIGCDRITKDLAKQHLMNQPMKFYFHDTFILEYVENTGAALSLGDSLSKPASFWLLSILPLVFLIILFIYALWHIRELTTLKLLSFSLVIAGGIGNIIDRIFFDRHVTDFMNIGIKTLRTGIFNFADVCVTAGVIGFLLSYREKKPEEVIEPDHVN